MKKSGVLIIFVGIFYFSGCATLSVEERVQTHMQRGFHYLENGHLIWAIAEFNRVIQLDPHFADGYYGRGASYFFLRRFDVALNDFRKVLEIDPNFVNAEHVYSGIAAALFGQNDHANALAYVERSLSINSNNYLALRTKRQIEERVTREAAEEARRLAREEANRFDPANFIIVPNNFAPADYTFVDLFRAASTARDLHRTSNRLEAGVRQLASIGLGNTLLMYVSDLTFVRQDGLNITFSSDDNAISQRMTC